MSTVRFVEPEHVEVLREYLGSDDGGALVLVYPEAQAEAVKSGLSDGDFVDYAFGGESDLMVDIVSTENHCFFTSI